MLSEKAGFKTEKILTLPLDVFYISQLSEKYKSASLAFIKGISKAVVFAFLTLFNRRKSSSVIYIIRKPSD